MEAPERLLVGAQHASLRIDQFLAASGLVSRTRARVLLAAGSVYVDKKRIRVASRLVSPGQKVEVYLNPPSAPRGPEGPRQGPLGPEAEHPAEQEPVTDGRDASAGVSIPPDTVSSVPETRGMALTVLYQDAHILAVQKPAGMPVQPSRASALGSTTETLIREHGISRQALRVVHRLDSGVSGVVILALTRAAAAGLSRQLASHSAARYYLAVVAGRVDGSGTLRHYLTDVLPPVEAGGIPRVRARDAVGAPRGGERLAITHLTPLAWRPEGAPWTLLLLGLETGRTHQIRAQLAAAGHPLLGDRRYGGPDLPRGPLKRIALHALRLELVHPSSGKALRVDAPLPPELRSFLELHHLWLPALQPDEAGRLPLSTQEVRNGQDHDDASAHPSQGDCQGEGQ